MISIESPIVIQTTNTTPSAPTSGYILLYMKSDNILYIRLSDGTEKRIS